MMTIQTLERKLKGFEEPLENNLLRWLYLHLPPQPILNKKMHRAYAKAVSILLRERTLGTLDHESSEAVARYLSAVTPFIEEFEKEEFPLNPATPEDILRFLIEQHNLSQYDLAKDLGGQPVVSDILRGRRKLTREHIERLSRRFHIHLATFYPPLPKAA